MACTEMISAKGLVYGLRQKKGDSATEELLVTTPDDTPLVVQLFGEDPAFIAAAAQELLARGFSWFDLNMGCSVPKVTKTGAGAALLKEPKQALAVASALFKSVGPGRAGCKMRLGWDADRSVYLELAKDLENAGAAWITLHPRFARQGFSGPLDLEALERLVCAVDIPVLASGDLFSAEDGLARLATGAAGVMFARGAMTNPAIFQQYLTLYRKGTSMETNSEERPQLPSVAEELLRMIRRHAELARTLTPGRPRGKGLSPALVKMRTVVPRYIRHLPGSKRLRLALTRCESWQELDGILYDFFQLNSSEVE